MPDRPFIEKLLLSMPRSKRQDILGEANVKRRTEDEGPGFLVELTPAEVAPLVVPLLRRVRLTDQAFRQVTSEAGLALVSPLQTSGIEIKFPIVSAYSKNGLPVTELALSSLILWELSFRIAHILQILGIPESLEAPEVSVSPGSVNYSLGGGTHLVAGIGLMVAAHVAIPAGAGATLAYEGGSLVLALGIVDLLINWTRTVSDTEKSRSEAALNRATTRLTELQIEKTKRELAPASALVPTPIIVAESKRFGIEPALATQVINEVMPAYDELTRHSPQPIQVSTSGAGGRAASARGGL